jgi:hypothetical protein
MLPTQAILKIMFIHAICAGALPQTESAESQG